MIHCPKRIIITNLGIFGWYSLKNTQQKELRGSEGGAPSEKSAHFEPIGVGNTI